MFNYKTYIHFIFIMVIQPINIYTYYGQAISPNSIYKS